MRSLLCLNRIFDSFYSTSHPLSDRITIVLPNFNNDYVLDDVISSIIAQKNVLLDLNIIDNNSTDSSWKIISTYTARYDWIRAIQVPFNTGPHTTSSILIRSALLHPHTVFASGNDCFY